MYYIYIYMHYIYILGVCVCTYICVEYDIQVKTIIICKG